MPERLVAREIDQESICSPPGVFHLPNPSPFFHFVLISPFVLCPFSFPLFLVSLHPSLPSLPPLLLPLLYPKLKSTDSPG